MIYNTIVALKCDWHHDNEADKESAKRANNTVLSVIEFYLKLIVVEDPYSNHIAYSL